MQMGMRGPLTPARLITGGCGASTYCPTNTVNRQQMAVFLVKTFTIPF